MYNLLSKTATELTKEIGDAKAPSINPYSEHIHCTSYINTSQMPVLTVPEVKRILPLIHPCFPSEEARTEKRSDELKLHSELGQESGFISKSLDPQARVFSTRLLQPPLNSNIFRLLLCSQSCNLQTSANSVQLLNSITDPTTSVTQLIAWKS